MRGEAAHLPLKGEHTSKDRTCVTVSAHSQGQGATRFPGSQGVTGGVHEEGGWTLQTMTQSALAGHHHLTASSFTPPHLSLSSEFQSEEAPNHVEARHRTLRPLQRPRRPPLSPYELPPRRVEGKATHSAIEADGKQPHEVSFRRLFAWRVERAQNRRAGENRTCCAPTVGAGILRPGLVLRMVRTSYLERQRRRT